MARISEFLSRSNTSGLTGRFCSAESPQSPLMKFPAQVKYCLTSGWSVPSLWFSASTCPWLA